MGFHISLHIRATEASFINCQRAGKICGGGGGKEGACCKRRDERMPPAPQTQQRRKEKEVNVYLQLESCSSSPTGRALRLHM